MRPVSFLSVLSLLAVVGLAGCGDKTPAAANKSVEPVAAAPAENKVVVYSARAEHLIKPLFDEFTKQTGVRVEFITDQAGPLLARLQSESSSTPADILLTTDVGNLWQAKEQQVLQAIQSAQLEQNVPAHLRDKDNYWFGLTQRARTIVYASDRVKPEALSTYEALADGQWQGRLCLRTSKKVYNQSLVASLIAHEGKEKAASVVKGWVANLALQPFGDDNAAMEAVKSGLCDVTIVNTYYFGELEAAGKAGSLKIFWPNQAGASAVDSRGVHMNISGAGITRYAKHPQQARQLVEWLSGPAAQGMLAGLNLEFPVNPAVPPVAQVQAWGEFKADTLPLHRMAEHQLEAVRLIDEAGYQ